MTAMVTADLVNVRAGVSAAVTVMNPGGAVSNSVTMTIDPPRPVILALNPVSAAAGSPAVTIVITGSNFASNCVVRWNGTAVETAFNDAGRVIASVPGSLLVNAGVVPITVTNPSGLIANPMTFTVTPSSPVAEPGQSVVGDGRGGGIHPDGAGGVLHTNLHGVVEQLRAAHRVRQHGASDCSRCRQIWLPRRAA